VEEKKREVLYSKEDIYFEKIFYPERNYKERDYLNIPDIVNSDFWSLDQAHREHLSDFFFFLHISEPSDVLSPSDFSSSHSSLLSSQQEILEFKTDWDLKLIRKRDIVAMTVTGCAKNMQLLQKMAS
jgi:hypothetical protein